LPSASIVVDHVTVYRWVQRFASEFAEAARARRHVVGDRWRVDETYVKVAGTWRYLFRAIDQFGQVIDVYLSPRRNTEAARRFFAQALDRTRTSPVEVTTDRYRLYLKGAFIPIGALTRGSSHCWVSPSTGTPWTSSEDLPTPGRFRGAASPPRIW
jgi:transposase-like protein